MSQKENQVLPRVLYEGSKCFWRTRNTLDVTIVEHEDFAVVEVLAYDPGLDAEAPRLYLDDINLRSKVDATFIDRFVRLEKEKAMRKKITPDSRAYHQKAVDQARVDYILDRLFVKSLQADERKIVVELQFSFSDRDGETGGPGVGEMVIRRPHGMHPFQSFRHQPLMM